MSEEHSLVDIMNIARKRWLWVAGPILALVLLAWLYTDRQTPRYEATARVVLSEDASTRVLDPGSQNPGFLAREIENQIALAHGDEVEALLIAELGELPELAVSHNPESDILLFRAEWPTADGAARAANTWAEIFVNVRQTRDIENLDRAMAGLEARLATLRAEQDTIRVPLDLLRRQIRAESDPVEAARLQLDYDLMADDLRYELDLNTSEAQTTVDDLAQLRLQAELAGAEQNLIAEPADVPDDPANTPLSRILVIAIIAGVVIGLGLAVMADARDKAIRTAADLQELTELPLLAAVPRARWSQRQTIGRATAEDPKGIHADAFHQIRSALEFEMHLRPLGSVLVTSPSAGDGRSTVAANLAIALGSVGARTALADSDYRTGSLHRIFDIRREPGLSDLVKREIEASRVAHYVSGEDGEDLVVLPSGTAPGNPAAFVASPRFLSTLKWMGTQVDVVVVDAPPVLGIPETHTLAREVDGVVLVVRTKRTTEDELQEAIAVLDQVRARVVGVVLLGVPRTRRTLQQYIRARRQAALNLPPVLNVNEGARTADYQIGADQSHDQTHGGTPDLKAETPQPVTPVADLAAGQTTQDTETGTSENTAIFEDAPGPAPYDAEQDPVADLDADAEAELGVAHESDPSHHGFVILAADADDQSTDDIQSVNGDQSVVAVDEPISRNGHTAEDDWFHDRIPAETNGHSETLNGHDPADDEHDVADIEEVIDIDEPSDEPIEELSADADEIEADERIDDALDGDLSGQHEQQDAPVGSNGTAELSVNGYSLVDPADIVDGIDNEIVDLAELDDGLV